jgi:hypothetical protein
MTTVSETTEPTRQECPNRRDLEDRFYINEPTAWVTCIVTRPGDNLEHRESFILGRGVYRPSFNSLIGRGFRVELSADYDNGREWGTIYNCCGGRTFLDVSVNESDERVAEIAIEMENEPTFYCPTRLFHYDDGRYFVIGLAEGNSSTPTCRPEE